MTAQQSSELDFKSFSLFQLLTGTPIYKFDIFYRIKKILVRYDQRTDYVNYGYWRDGYETPNPSAELVSLVASKLRPQPGDVLLNCGSGMGQPDVDVVREFDVGRIIGINISDEQVAHANRKFADEGVADRVSHRVLDVGEIVDTFKDEGIDHVLCVEAIAEFPDFEKFLRDAYELLPPGGRISLCDDMRVPDAGVGPIKRLAGRFLTHLTTILYSDNWRQAAIYKQGLADAGFAEIEEVSIGAKVFPQSAQYAKERYPLLKRDKVPALLRVFAYLNLRGLDVMFRWQQIDYVLFSAVKPENKA